MKPTRFRVSRSCAFTLTEQPRPAEAQGAVSIFIVVVLPQPLIEEAEDFAPLDAEAHDRPL
jgi:hypothetical protein